MVTGKDKNYEKYRPDMSGSGFYTMKGYERACGELMTSSMEDYLEMICRMEAEGVPVRVSLLASNLHVRPSSASKMLDNLRTAGYIDFKKYGTIMVTDKGRREGGYLLHRHQVLHEFFCALNHTDSELEQVEKIEHYINGRTIASMERMLPLLKMDMDSEADVKM